MKGRAGVRRAAVQRDGRKEGPQSPIAAENVAEAPYSTGASDTSSAAPGVTVMLRRAITRRSPFIPSMT